jgi:uncharacterized alkaline shock family protein YloU
MSENKPPLGSIHVMPRAITSIAYYAALQSYGVVGFTSKNMINGLAHALVKDPTLGVEVSYNDEAITIDLYIIVEYGTRVSSVARSVSNTVRYHIESALAVPVKAVNVHVQGLRISDYD